MKLTTALCNERTSQSMVDAELNLQAAASGSLFCKDHRLPCSADVGAPEIHSHKRVAGSFDIVAGLGAAGGSE